MIGLNSFQIEVYEAAKAWDARHLDEPFVAELSALLNWGRLETMKRIHACIKRGYLAYDDDGKVIANEPPHERAMRMVCKEFKVHVGEVTGPSQSKLLLGARREITNRLWAVGYGFVDIGLVINRHPATINEYLFPRQGGVRPKVNRERVSSCMA